MTLYEYVIEIHKRVSEDKRLPEKQPEGSPENLKRIIVWFDLYKEHAQKVYDEIVGG